VRHRFVWVNDMVSGESSTRYSSETCKGDEQVRELVTVSSAGEERLVSAEPFVLLFWMGYRPGDGSACFQGPGGEVVGCEPSLACDVLDCLGVYWPVRVALFVLVLEESWEL